MPEQSGSSGIRRRGKNKRKIKAVASRNKNLVPITDIELLCSTINPIDDCKASEGFVKLPQDLNYGSGGRFIYLSVKRGNTSPISEIEILVSTSADFDDTTPSAGFEKLETNLNEGASGGHPVYLAIKRGGPPIIDIQFLQSTSINHDDSEQQILPNYILLDGNVNHGTVTGRFIRIAIDKVNRGIYTWGRNQVFQLGHPGKQPEYLPRVVYTLYNIPQLIMVSCGNEHTLALAKDGRVFGWGCGRNGRIGNAACKNQNLPTHINTFTDLQPFSKVVSVSAGMSHSAALTADGRAFTWGCAANGRLGIAKMYDHFVPTQVSSLIFLNHAFFFTSAF